MADFTFCVILVSSYQGHVGAALVLGGVDNSGAHLFTVHPHGSTDKLPYVSMGEGEREREGYIVYMDVVGWHTHYYRYACG